MKSALVTAALAAVLAAPAIAQPPTVTADGNVRVEGVAPEKVLGAIDTEKLVNEPAPPTTAEATPIVKSITVDTKTVETPAD